MFIIVEGPDFSGKSTLIKKLKDRLKNLKEIERIDYKDKGVDWMKLIDFYGEAQYSVIKQLLPALSKKQHFIIDRFFISSMVYSQVFHRNYDHSYIDIYDWERDDVLIILISPDYEVLIDRVEGRQKEKKEDKRILKELYNLCKVFNRTAHFMQLSNMIVLSESFTDKDIDKIVERIKS